MHNQRRDGAMAVGNGGGAPNYATVVAAGTSPSGFGFGDTGSALHGDAGRYDAYTQAGNLFRLLATDEQHDLCVNMAGPLSACTPETRERQLAHLDKADPGYGAGVRAALRAREDLAAVA